MGQPDRVSGCSSWAKINLNATLTYNSTRSDPIRYIYSDQFGSGHKIKLNSGRLGFKLKTSRIKHIELYTMKRENFKFKTKGKNLGGGLGLGAADRCPRQQIMDDWTRNRSVSLRGSRWADVRQQIGRRVAADRGRLDAQ